MNNVTIKSIIIDNFRGIRHATLAFDETKNEIVLPNGGGKTSIKLAFNWCLGANVADFIPKDNNKEIEDLTTSVAMKVNVNGVDYTLTRTSTGKYKLNEVTGSRNKITNESKYYIDAIEMIEKDYLAKVLNLFGAEIKDIKFLTELGYFTNDRADFTRKQRKKMLFDLCGVQQSIEDLLKRDEFDSIHDLILKGFTTAEIKSMIAKERKGYKDKINEFQILINNKHNEISEYELINFAEIEDRRNKAKKELEELSYNKSIAEDKIMVDNKLKLSKLKNELSKITLEDTNLLESKRNKSIALYKQCKDLGGQIEEKQADIKAVQTNIKHLEEMAGRDDEMVCSLCKQKLPKTRLAAIKKEREDRISEESKRAEALQADETLLLNKYNELKAEYQVTKQEMAEFTPNAKIATLRAEIETLDKIIEETSKSATTGLLEAKKHDLMTEIEVLSAKLALREVLSLGKDKIEEWRKQSMELSNGLILTERKELALIKFMREQSQVVEAVVNAKFGDGITWALFNTTYKNGDGGVEEECCPMMNGTRYESLSNGEKYICDLKIIKVLQSMYNCKLPVIIDNFEGITLDIPNTETQTIALIAGAEKTQNLNIIAIKSTKNEVL